VSKTTAVLGQAQPFLRDQYATVRKEVGPRLAHTRDVAVPMAMDMSQKAVDVSNRVRGEYLPVATKRAMLAAAALRGDELRPARDRRRWGLVAAATAAGVAAVLGLGAYVWQRKRNEDMWSEESFEDSRAMGDRAPADDRAGIDAHHH
jgi:hypothetical protein